MNQKYESKIIGIGIVTALLGIGGDITGLYLNLTTPKKPAVIEELLMRNDAISDKVSKNPYLSNAQLERAITSENRKFQTLSNENTIRQGLEEYQRAVESRKDNSVYCINISFALSLGGLGLIVMGNRSSITEERKIFLKDSLFNFKRLIFLIYKIE